MNLTRCFIVGLCFLTSLWANAQQGGFYITHHSPDHESIDNLNFEIVQDQQGIINIANRAGVIRFDGSQWDLIRTPSVIVTLELDRKNNILYTGGHRGLGKVDLKSSYDHKYEVLSDSSDFIENVSHLILLDKKLYAINHQQIGVFDTQTGHFEVVKPRYSGELLSLGVLNNRVYVTSVNSGLQWFEAETGLNSPVDKRLKNLNPSFIRQSSAKDCHLIGDDNFLYIYKNNKLKKLELGEDQQYLDNGIITDAAWINESLVAISTLKAGLVFIDVKSQSIDQILNDENGLPDNEIYALKTDSETGLWVAHNQGFTRVSPQLPFRSYDRYPGLSGEILTVKNFKDTLYVGTSKGLYYLKEINEFDEQVEYIKSEQTVTETVSKKKIVQSKKNGVLNFLKKNRRQKLNEVSFDSTYKRKVISYKKNVTKKLIRTRYNYVKVSGLDSKVQQISTLDSRLFVSGLDGAFEIKNKNIIPISQRAVRYMHIVEKHPSIYISTHDNLIEVFDISKEDYRPIYMFGDFRSYVSHIFQDQSDRIWFCGEENLFWIKVKNDQIVDNQEYFIKNSFFYDTYGVSRNDSIFLLNGHDKFYLDEEKRKVRKVNVKGGFEYSLAGNQTGIWEHTKNNEWQKSLKSGLKKAPDLLSLLKDIKYISKDDHNDYWVISGDNSFYKIPATVDQLDEGKHDLFVKKITSGDKSISPTKKFILEQNTRELIFEFVLPEYSGILNLEYQYQLKGYDKKWSEWLPYNKFPFRFLPYGNYTLNVRSRNTLGHVYESKPISFEILPPYWKRWWFYALEFLGVALILMIIAKIRKWGYRDRLFSRILALLSIVIIVELIEGLAENQFGKQASPVYGFITQVLIAIIILPIEGWLRKNIIKGSGVKASDFIKNKK